METNEEQGGVRLLIGDDLAMEDFEQPWVQRTPLRQRLIFNTRRRPFPYLLHPWEIMDPQGFIFSGSARRVCRWMAEWHTLEVGDDES